MLQLTEKYCREKRASLRNMLVSPHVFQDAADIIIKKEKGAACMDKKSDLLDYLASYHQCAALHGT